MSEIRTLVATIPVGDPDLGAEVECEITYEYTPETPPSWDDPGAPEEAQFIEAQPLCNGKPSPYYGAFADLEFANLQDIARDWLENT
jgi:hypothetical protein